MNIPVLSIIIPTKDRQEVFQCSYSELLKSVDPNIEIIIVNDSDETFILEHLPFNVQVFKNPKSGVASARNFGVKQSKSDLLLFMDDDMIVTRENIEFVHDFLLANDNSVLNLNWVYPEALIDRIKKTLFGRYLIKSGFTSLKGWNGKNYWDDHSLFESKGITSQFLGISKKDFIRIGGYCEEFPFAGAEDYEFGKRLSKSGIKSFIYPKLFVFHNEFDRIKINPWLDRKGRSGLTRKVAVKMGYSELGINHNLIKNSLLSFLINFKGLIIKSLVLIPNNKKFDSFYFKILNILLAIALLEGYRKG